MIAIVNVSPVPQETGPHLYEVRINRRVVATFVHKREKGLAACLRKAARAVETQEKIKNENTPTLEA